MSISERVHRSRPGSAAATATAAAAAAAAAATATAATAAATAVDAARKYKKQLGTLGNDVLCACVHPRRHFPLPSSIVHFNACSLVI